MYFSSGEDYPLIFHYICFFLIYLILDLLIIIGCGIYWTQMFYKFYFGNKCYIEVVWCVFLPVHGSC